MEKSIEIWIELIEGRMEKEREMEIEEEWWECDVGWIVGWMFMKKQNHCNHHTFTIQLIQLHKHSKKSLKMKDESEGLIANTQKQVVHMVLDNLVSGMVEYSHQ